MTTIPRHRSHGAPPMQKKRPHFAETKTEKKERKFVTTNVLFKTHPHRISKRTKHSATEKRSGLGKSILTKRRQPSPSPSPSPPPKKKYTLASESNGLLNDYKTHVTVAADRMLNRTYKDLVKQLEQTTLAPDALGVRIAHLADVVDTLTTPLDDEKVSTNYRDPKGNVVRREEFRIVETVERFKAELQKKRNNLESLWEQWDEVRQEIAEVGARILHEPKFPQQFGLEAIVGRPGPLSKSNPEVENIRRMIQDETERARSDVDQEAEDNAAAHKRHNAMWLAWLNANAV